MARQLTKTTESHQGSRGQSDTHAEVRARITGIMYNDSKATVLPRNRTH